MAKTTPETPKPRISVLERRLQNPFGEPSIPIQLKDPSLLCRWFNGALSSDKIWRAKHVKGWQLVKPEMIVDMDQIGGYTLGVDNTITRGERGQEVLLCMPRDDFDQIMMAKTQHNLRNMGNPAGMKQEILEAAGTQLGDEAASFLNQKIRAVGGVTDQYERIERREVE